MASVSQITGWAFCPLSEMYYQYQKHKALWISPDSGDVPYFISRKALRRNCRAVFRQKNTAGCNGLAASGGGSNNSGKRVGI